MSVQTSLFSANHLASSVQIPPAPTQLTPHTGWPFPGMTPNDSARASFVSGDAYNEMLAAVIQSKGGARITAKEVLASIPADWRDLCGPYAHGFLPSWIAKKHNIESTYVAHDGGGFHFEYRAGGAA